jgi:hypothetical protein
VNPAPNATMSTVDPSLIRPHSIASSSAIGMDADVDLLHRNVRVFRSRFDDSDVRLMRDHEIDVVAR